MEDKVEEIIEVIIMEQLVDTIPSGVQIRVREHRPKTGVRAADDYFDARKGIQNDFQRRPQTYLERPTVVSNDKEKDKKANNQPKKKEHVTMETSKWTTYHMQRT